VRGILALLDGDFLGPVNVGNPNEFPMLELARRKSAGKHLPVSFIAGDALRA